MGTLESMLWHSEYGGQDLNIFMTRPIHHTPMHKNGHGVQGLECAKKWRTRRRWTEHATTYATPQCKTSTFSEQHGRITGIELSVCSVIALSASLTLSWALESMLWHSEYGGQDLNIFMTRPIHHTSMHKDLQHSNLMPSGLF